MYTLADGLAFRTIAFGLLLAAGVAIDPPPAAAQAPVAFERIPPGSGLSQNTVNALVQDRTGFLWVGTRDGLNRYDGYGFVTYRHDPDDPRSLCHDHVLSLYESAVGDLWVGTESGLCRYDRTANQFERVADLKVSTITEDRDGAVWLRGGGARSRITRLDTASATTRSYGPFAARRMLSVAGDIWIDTPDGTRRYDAPSDTWMPVALPSVAGAPSRVVATAPGAGVWLYGGRELARWHPGRDEVARAGGLVPSPATDGLDAAPLTSLLEFEGAVYVGTADGLYRRQSGERTWTKVPLGAATDMLTRSVKTLYVDRAGTLWAGTMAGLFRADPYAKRFARLDLAPPPGAPATAFLEAADDQLWIGTLGGGLLRVDARDGRVTALVRDTPDAASEDVIWMLHADASGVIWAATDHGLMRLDPAQGTRRQFLLLPDNGRRPGSNSFTSLAADPDGAIWAGTYSGAVVRFDPATEQAEVYEAWAGIYRAVQALHHDGETLWVGGHRRGVRRFDTRARRLLPVDAADAAFEDASVWMFHSGTDGRLWAATNEGLFARDRESGVVTRYLDPSLPSRVVYTVGEDGMGRIWASTNGGLLLLDPRKPPGRRFLLFGPADGVPASEFIRRAVLAARDGRLLFGALEGIVSFDPARVRLNERPPAVAIASVGVHGRTGDRTFYPHAGEPLILAPRDTSVTFDVVALSFTDAGRNRYSYRLDGFDADWSTPSGDRRARYTHVPAGRYVFRVRGSNSDGVWNEEGVVLDVVVHAPYWQQWWFRLLAGALVAGLAFAAHRSRLRRLLGVERIRQQVATDLHDDLGSGLAHIAVLSETSRRRLPDAARPFEEVAGLARDLRESMADIVWAVDSDRDRLIDLVARMRHTAYQGLDIDGLTVEFVAPPDTEIERIELAPDRRRQVLRMFKETIANVARHARATRVRIELTIQDGVLRLVVTDNGCGFDPERRYDGHGMRGLRLRAGQIGADLHVRSGAGRGTTVTIRLPLRRRRVLDAARSWLS